MSLRVLISAGEVSGDQHLARVVAALKTLAPGCEVRGMAGRLSREAGAALDVDCYRAGAGMGFLELFRSGGKILSSFRTLSGIIRDWKPNLLILVDYPDFNLRLAKVAKSHGVKVLYFIPPKVWAWRSRRVKKMKRFVDRIAAIFPFEPAFYSKHEFRNVLYVGHPLAETIASENSSSAREETVLLLPGSRRFEVERLLVPMLKAFEILKQSHPALKPVVLLAPNIEPAWVRGLIGDTVSRATLDLVEWSHEQPLVVMQRAKVGVLKSGTCNLEAAIAGLPFVCVYSGTLLAKVIVSLFVALTEFSPVNIIKPHTVAELMQVRLSPEDVAREIASLIENSQRRTTMERDLLAVREALRGDASERLTVSERVARCVIEMGDVNQNEPKVVGQGVHNV
jgi:lipid-A-disaccharide synthase